MFSTLGELALLVDGQAVGPVDLAIQGAAPLRDAVPGDITLADSADRGRTLAGSQAAAVVCPRSFTPEDMPAILVDDVHAAFAKIVLHFRPRRAAKRIGVSRMSAISTSAVLGANVDVHPFATIGDDVTIGAGSTIHAGAHIMAGCRIGENVTIFPGAVLYENTIVGDRTIIHAAAVLGAYGFGYELVEGRHQLTPQLGNVVVGADVEIGAGTTIDRGTYGPTVIGDGTKIDDQVMIAHNCRLGRHNMLCSQVGVAGSSTTGDYVVLAGQVGVRDHVHIGSPHGRRRQGRHRQRRAGKQPLHRHSRHARARAEAAAGCRLEAAGNAAPGQGLAADRGQARRPDRRDGKAGSGATAGGVRNQKLQIRTPKQIQMTGTQCRLSNCDFAF